MTLNPTQSLVAWLWELGLDISPSILPPQRPEDPVLVHFPDDWPYPDQLRQQVLDRVRDCFPGHRVEVARLDPEPRWWPTSPVFSVSPKDLLRPDDAVE